MCTSDSMCVHVCVCVCARIMCVSLCVLVSHQAHSPNPSLGPLLPIDLLSKNDRNLSYGRKFWWIAEISVFGEIYFGGLAKPVL